MFEGSEGCGVVEGSFGAYYNVCAQPQTVEALSDYTVSGCTVIQVSSRQDCCCIIL